MAGSALAGAACWVNCMVPLTVQLIIRRYALYRRRWSARTGASKARDRRREHDCGAFGTVRLFTPPIASTETKINGSLAGALHQQRALYAGLVCALSFPLNCISSSHHPGRLVFSPPASLSILISISPLQKPGNAFRNNQSVNLGVTLTTWVSLADRWMSINSPRGLNDLMNSGDTLPI